MRARRPIAPPGPAGRGARQAGPGSSAARRSTRGPAWRVHPSLPATRAPSSISIPTNSSTIERIALGRARDPGAHRRGGPLAGYERIDQFEAQSPSVSGSSRIVVALSLPPPQVGRSSRNSGRAGQMKRIGESRVRSATDSIRSSRVGSAQWMSSMRTIERTSRPRGAPDPAERPDELLLGGGRLEADEPGEATCDRRGLGQSGDEASRSAHVPFRRRRRRRCRPPAGRSRRPAR